MSIKYLVCVVLGCFLLSHDARCELGVDWREVTAAAPFTVRAGHATVVFKDMIWVLGGVSPTARLGGVWSSKDGVSWQQVMSLAPWGPRSGFVTVAFANKLWVIGGMIGDYASFAPANDVWCSEDGLHWTCVLPNAPWMARTEHTAVVYDNKIWILGGSTALNDYSNEVWCSADGANWTLVTQRATWSPRCLHASVVFDNKMWVMGGYGPVGGSGGGNRFGDVWASSDGVNWTLMTSHAPWGIRNSANCLALNGRIWLMGGTVNSGAATRDVWFTTNGWQWTCATSQAPWSERVSSAVAFKKKMFIVGGWHYRGGLTQPGHLNDVWSSQEAWHGPAVHLITPNGMEILNGGARHSIRWEMDTETAGTGVRFEIWDSIGRVADLGYGWSPDGESVAEVYFPLLPERSDYKIRIISTWNPSLYDESDQPFTILGQPLRLQMPNGGEIWTAGARQFVWWESNPLVAGTGVKFELWRAGTKVKDLGFGWDPDGEGVTVVIAPSIAPASNYVVRMISTWDPAWFDDSDQFITIRNVGFRNAVAPGSWLLYQ